MSKDLPPDSSFHNCKAAQKSHSSAENHQKSVESEKYGPSWFVIPAYVKRCKTLRAETKLIYMEIHALTGERGYCFASNPYFERELGISQSALNRAVNDLTEHGFARVVWVGKQRRIFLENNSSVEQKEVPGSGYVEPSTYPEVGRGVPGSGYQNDLNKNISLSKSTTRAEADSSVEVLESHPPEPYRELDDVIWEQACAPITLEVFAGWAKAKGRTLEQVPRDELDEYLRTVRLELSIRAQSAKNGSKHISYQARTVATEILKHRAELRKVARSEKAQREAQEEAKRRKEELHAKRLEGSEAHELKGLSFEAQNELIRKKREEEFQRKTQAFLAKSQVSAGVEQ